MPAVRRVERVLAHARRLWLREPFWAEVFAALGVLLWALSSIANAAPLSARPALATAVSIAPGWAWEFGGLALALVQLAALAFDHVPTRRAACFVGTWWWSVLFLSFMQHDPGAPSATLYLPPLLANALSILRVRYGDAHVEDR